MPYTPTVNDMSGEILAKYQAAGADAMAGGISSAGQSLASGIVSAAQAHQATQKELSALDGKAGYYSQSGMMDAKTLEKFQTGNLNTKRAVVSQMDAALFDKYKQQGFALDQGRLGLAQQKVAMDWETLNRVHPMGWEPSATTVQDANGQPITLVQTSPSQAQVVQKPTAATPTPTTEPVVRNVGGRDFYWNGARGTWQPVSEGNWMNNLLNSGGGGSTIIVPPASAATPTAPAAAPTLSAQDLQALQWAQANPNDPRSAQIKQRLGVQ